MTDQVQGQSAFDFIYGHWRIHDVKLRDATDPHCDDWVEFGARSEAYPLLGGIGHLDRMVAEAPPGGSAFEAFTLRLFDSTEGTWSIYWSSTRAPGRLDPAVVGRFIDGIGVFEGEDVVGDQAVKVRFEWRSLDPCMPTWQQSFSFDQGLTWKHNWTMQFRREGDLR